MQPSQRQALSQPLQQALDGLRTGTGGWAAWRAMADAMNVAEQLVVLRQERPTADSALFAATERVVDDADALVGEVCAAVETTHHLTMELAAKVGRRAEALRNELESVQRASTAGAAYGTAGGARLVDRRR